MVRLGDTDMRVTAAAGLVTDHVAEDARDVALERQVHEVVGHGEVLIELIRHTDRRVRRFGERVGAGVHALQLLFDTPYVRQVFVEQHVVGGAESALQALRLVNHRVDHALLLPQARQTLLGRPGIAEHALERHLRVDRNRQRARVVEPGDRVEEHARETVAGARRRAHVLGTDLKRPEGRVSGNDVSDVLIDRLLRFDTAVVAGLADRPDAVQPLRACAQMHRAIRRLHATDGDQMLAIGLKRHHVRLEFEIAAGLFRMPFGRVSAVGHVNRAEPERRARARLGESGHHCVEHRQGHGGPHASEERTAGQVLPGNEHCATPSFARCLAPRLVQLTWSASGTADCPRCPVRSTS